MADKKTFTLNSSSSEFSARSSDIFSNLNALEAKHKQYEEEHESDAIIQKDPDEESCQTITSSFKKPKHAPKRTHPQEFDRMHSKAKWAHYSLSDVPDNDLSDSANKKAAFDFLHERQKLREKEDSYEPVNVSDNACSKNRFKFGVDSKLHLKKDNPLPQSNTLSKSVELNYSGIDEEGNDPLSRLIDHDITEGSGASGTVFKKSHAKRSHKIRERLSDDEDDDCVVERERCLNEARVKQRNRRMLGKPKESETTSAGFEEVANKEYIEASEMLSDEDESYGDDALEDDTEYGY